MTNTTIKIITAFLLVLNFTLFHSCNKPEGKGKTEMKLSETALQETSSALIEKHGPNASQRIKIGVKQVADRWKATDGEWGGISNLLPGELYYRSEWIRSDFRLRFQKNLESLYGNLNRSLNVILKWVLDVDCGKVFFRWLSLGQIILLSPMSVMTCSKRVLPLWRF